MIRVGVRVRASVSHFIISSLLFIAAVRRTALAYFLIGSVPHCVYLYVVKI